MNEMLAPHYSVRTLYIIGISISIIYGLVGVLTWSYPPEYLGYGQVWAIVFATAAAATLVFLLSRVLFAGVLSGALLVGSALFRSAAIFIELGWDRLYESVVGLAISPISSSFAIAGTTWLLIAMLLWLGWPILVARLLRATDG